MDTNVVSIFVFDKFEFHLKLLPKSVVNIVLYQELVAIFFSKKFGCNYINKNLNHLSLLQKPILLQQYLHEN